MKNTLDMSQNNPHHLTSSAPDERQHDGQTYSQLDLAIESIVAWVATNRNFRQSGKALILAVEVKLIKRYLLHMIGAFQTPDYI